jgi:thiamine biosynthesis protein ThiS
MKITLNNRIEFFDEETLNIADILRIKNFTFKTLVIKINGQLIRKHQYNESTVNEGDNIEIIHLISGG